MATLTAASLSVPSFSGLRLSDSVASKPLISHSVAPIRSHASASLSDLASKVSAAATSPAALAFVASTASLLLASSPALAAKIDAGDDAGSFKFSPSSVTVSAGEPIVFTLVGETPHNVIFDIPSGAPSSVVSDLRASSMGENDVLSEEGETFTAKINTPGTYTYYCTPHKTSNMIGSVTVK